MKNLLIIGAGNVGGFLAYNIGELGEFEVRGFLDDDPKKIGKMMYGHRVLGPIRDISNFCNSEIHLAIGISYPRIRSQVAAALREQAFTFPTLTAKTAWLSKKVEIGAGSIVYPGVSINYETKLDEFVLVNMNCAIGHNCLLGPFSTLAPGVNLAGYTQVEEGANLGIGVSTRQKSVIGRFSEVGGQAMVLKTVAPDTTVIGVPARRLDP